MAGNQTVRSLATLVRQAARVDHIGIDPWVALRNAVGFTVPLVIGKLAGSIPAALPACVGALLASFADQPGPYRLRSLKLATVTVATGLYTGLSVAASRSPFESVALLTAASFLAGLLVAAGNNTATLASLAVLSGTVMGHLAEPASLAAHIGLLLAAGAAGQGLLAVLAWPVSRHRPERLVLAALYQRLAEAVRQPPDPQATLPASEALEAGRRVLYGVGNSGPPLEDYRRLLSEAERIRWEIVTLTALAERVRSDGNEKGADVVWRCLRAAGDVLEAAAEAVRGRTAIDPAAVAAVDKTMRTAGCLLRRPGGHGEPTGTGEAAAVRIDALAGQLRALVPATAQPRKAGPPMRDRRRSWRPADIAAVTRSALHEIDARVLQHAVRLALLMGASDLAGRLLGYQRAYWVPLTIVVILRPDFESTFQRTTMRVAGQLVGLVLTWSLLRWVLHGTWGEILAAGVFMFGARICGRGNLGFAAVNIAGLVVLLLNLDGYPAGSLLLDRGLATLVGGAIVLLAMLAWPSWERHYVPERLASLLAFYAAYLEVISNPVSTRAECQAARVASRVARASAEVSVERAASEPVQAGAVVELGRSVLATSHRVIRASVTLDAMRDQFAAAGAQKELLELLEAAAGALRRCSLAITSNDAPRGLVHLRPLQLSFARALVRANRGGPQDLVLAEATDRLTDSVNTIAAELGQRLPVQLPPAGQARQNVNHKRTRAESSASHVHARSRPGASRELPGSCH